MILNETGLSLLANLTLIVRQQEAEFPLVWDQLDLLPKDYCEGVRCVRFTRHDHPQACPTCTCWYL